MSILDLLNDEDEFAPNIITITDTDSITAEYEFLDIVQSKGISYAVLCPVKSDGYVDIFRIIYVNGEEKYKRETDDKTLDRVFEIFRIKNEDEFDFD